MTILLLSLLSLAAPSFVFFPPPSRQSWQYRLFWLLFRVMIISLIALCVMCFSEHPPGGNTLRYAAWLPLFVVGFGLSTYLTLKLGWENAHGEANNLVVSGWYRWSRNPIYVTSLIGMLGLALFVGSSKVSVVLALWAAIYLLAPLLEERWLEKSYGEAFITYKAATSRFFGIPSQ